MTRTLLVHDSDMTRTAGADAVRLQGAAGEGVPRHTPGTGQTVINWSMHRHQLVNAPGIGQIVINWSLHQVLVKPSFPLVNSHGRCCSNRHQPVNTGQRYWSNRHQPAITGFGQIVLVKSPSTVRLANNWSSPSGAPSRLFLPSFPPLPLPPLSPSVHPFASLPPLPSLPSPPPPPPPPLPPSLSYLFFFYCRRFPRRSSGQSPLGDCDLLQIGIHCKTLPQPAF